MFILGVADLLAALILVRGFYHFSLPAVIVYAFAGYLIVKGLIFLKDIGSLIDIGGGILLILSVSASLPLPLLLVFTLLIGLKGALTIMAGAMH